MSGGSLIKRTLTAILFCVVFIGCLLHPISYALFGVFCIVEMMHEYYKMSLGAGEYKAERIFASIFGAGAFLLVMAIFQFHLELKWLGILFFPMAALQFMLLFYKKGASEGRNDERVLFPLSYIVIPVSISVPIMYNSEGAYSPWMFLMIFVLIWSSDVGAYILGMSLGQRPNSKKLYPAVSPKKSWAGVVGSVIFTTAIALTYHFTGIWTLGVIHSLAVALIVIVFGILGDLVESLIKREHNRKDSGNIMPGHGGLLDRFDGALFVVPTVTAYLYLFSLI